MSTGSSPCAPHGLLDLGDHGLDHEDARVALRVGRHDVPAPVLVVGALEHVLDRLGVRGALLPVAPVLVGQLPGLERVALAALEAAQLLVGRDVQPELDDQHALGGQRALEAGDLVVGAAPLLLGREALHPLDQHPPVPGAVEHGHAAPAGQRRREAPEEVVALLVGRRRRERGHAHVAVVELRGEALDRAALARRVPALEQDQTGGPSRPSPIRPPSWRRSADRRSCAAARRSFCSLRLSLRLRSTSSRRPTP